MNWATAAPVVATAFLSSLVEAVEALTIVLAVTFVRGWRPAVTGAIAGLAILALIVLALGPLLNRVPLQYLQLIVGVLLLLFGMRWLRKAILRSAGLIPLHDEAIAFASEAEALREQESQLDARLDLLAGLASFKAVVLEGLEVVFIVIAVGAGRGLPWARKPWRARGLFGRYHGRLRGPSSAGTDARKHPQVRRRSHAFIVRSILDW